MGTPALSNATSVFVTRHAVGYLRREGSHHLTAWWARP